MLRAIVAIKDTLLIRTRRGVMYGVEEREETKRETIVKKALKRVQTQMAEKEVIQRFSHITPLYNLERPEWTPNPTFHGIVTMPIKY
ncbi:hypothetical protein [Anoxybacillus eryuanensis]|uniref:hypothetical protein n=1 Tax=Anoxybacillus eryuanensis TaxID=651866 RepID=UPI003EF740DA